MRNPLFLVILGGILASSNAQDLPQLPLPLAAGTVEVWNNQIYHFGGSNNWAGSELYPRIYRFDGSSWLYHDSIPDYNLWDVESVLVNDEVYLISGWPSGSQLLRKYNLSNQEWTYLANSPNNSQTWGVTAEHLNGKIYLFLSNGALFEYSISNNSWETKSSISNTGTWDLSSILFRNEIYILGFYDSTFYKYTPNTDQWTRLANSPYRVGACAMGIINDLVYCVGGNLDGSQAAAYKSVIVYNITSNSWAIDSLQISGKRHWMATAEYQGGMYIIGGIDSTTQAVNIVEEIVPQGTAVGISETANTFSHFLLKQNYPNPFNPTTTITLMIHQSAMVKLEVYSTIGQKMETLLNEFMPKGEHKIVFRANHLPSGIYYYKMRADGYEQIRKMVLLK